MRFLIPLSAILSLAGTGCGRSEAESWKEKFLKEINYHYQTQQIKNAEIVAREIEIVNLKGQIGTLTDRIGALEKDLEAAKGKPRGPRKAIQAKVTAVAPEIHLAVLSVGDQDGVQVGDEFLILRGEERIARIVIDRLDRKWCAGKLSDVKSEPRVADDASNAALLPNCSSGHPVPR